MNMSSGYHQYVIGVCDAMMLDQSPYILTFPSAMGMLKYVAWCMMALPQNDIVMIGMHVSGFSRQAGDNHQMPS
jgi:hypothetical protein